MSVKRRAVAIIPTKTTHLVEKILRQVVDQVSAVFIMDNGLAEYPTIPKGREHKVRLYDSEGMGIHEMWNDGINEAQAIFHDVALSPVLLNDDVSIAKDFVSTLLEQMHLHPYLMAVCGNYDNRGGPAIQYTDQICAGRYDGTGGFAGFAFALRGKWVYGQYKYRFPTEMKWWGGDNDLLMSILKEDMKAAIIRDAQVVHLSGGSQTIGTPQTMSEEMRAQVIQDVRVLHEKWNLFPKGGQQ